MTTSLEVMIKTTILNTAYTTTLPTDGSAWVDMLTLETDMALYTPTPAQFVSSTHAFFHQAPPLLTI